MAGDLGADGHADALALTPAIIVTTSVLAEGECWLPELVADAGRPAPLAERLATTISAARRCHAAYAT